MLDRNAINIILKIGTSGYSYEDWLNQFYPPDLPKSQMLSFYCQYFKTVEVNATYYRIPDKRSFARMTEKTPPEFEFIVKVNQETTHIRKENDKAVKQLIEAVKPMEEQGKLSGFLAQFPYSFKNRESNRQYLLETKNYFGKYPLFVEFRHDSWVNEALMEFLKNSGIGYVNVDQPALPGLLPRQDWVTSDTAYVRFHGRNENDWWDGKGSARYNYEYTEEELKEWLITINNILKKTYKTYIFFNNHPNGQAVRNARQMMEIISQQLNIELR